MSKPSSCSVGLHLSDEQSCHSHTYSRKTGLKNFSEISEKDRTLLMLRCNFAESEQIVASSTICLHHECVWILYYDRLQKFCCNPYNIHSKQITSKLQISCLSLFNQITS